MRSERLVDSLRRLATALGRAERVMAQAQDVSVSQWRLLTAMLARPGGVQVSTLAQEQGLMVSTMTRNLQKLEARGWLRRDTGAKDRRTITVTLTPLGAERAQALRQATDALYRRAFADFHPTDRIERAVALDRVAAALEKVV